MIHVYTNPLLLDYLRIVAQMPEDERQQALAVTQQPFDIDRIAAMHYGIPGPKWVIKADDEPLVVGGFALQRPGVYQDYLLTTPAAWAEHWFAVTRICRRLMDAMLKSGTAHRLECISLASRERCWKWYGILGYNREATLHGYCANGADAIMFSRVRHL